MPSTINGHDGDGELALAPVAVGIAVEEGQQEQQQHGDAGDDRGADPFQLAGEVFQHLEQKQEVPFRAGDVGGVAGVGFGLVGHADKDRQQTSSKKMAKETSRSL